MASYVDIYVFDLLTGSNDHEAMLRWERSRLHRQHEFEAAVAAERKAREEQTAVERDRVALRRRAPPVQSSGGVSFPGRPRR